MWKWIKIPKGIALAAFLLPWWSVSCGSMKLVSANGVQLTLGKFSSDLADLAAKGQTAGQTLPGGAGQLPTGGQGIDIWLVLAVAAIVAGLAVACLRYTRNNALIVGATSIAALVLVWMGTMRFGKSAIMAEMGKQRPAGAAATAAGGTTADPFNAQQMGDAAAAMIQVNWQIGFMLTLLALAAAAVMAWLAYSGRDAAVGRSFGGAAGANGWAGGGFSQPNPSAMVTCPTCGRSYPLGTPACPADGTRLA